MDRAFHTMSFGRIAMFISLLANRQYTTQGTRDNGTAFQVIHQAYGCYGLGEFRRVDGINRFRQIARVQFVEAVATFYFHGNRCQRVTRVRTLRFRPRVARRHFRRFARLQHNRREDFRVSLDGLELAVDTRIFIARTFGSLVMAIGAKRRRRLFRRL